MLTKLIQFAVRDAKLTRKLVMSHPEVLDLRTSIGETALHYLAVENYSEAVELLIELGAEINPTNMFGHSALEEAKLVGAHETVEVLENAAGRLGSRLGEPPDDE